MVIDKQFSLPEGVGKKIVDALKKDEVEINNPQGTEFSQTQFVQPNAVKLETFVDPMPNYQPTVEPQDRNTNQQINLENLELPDNVVSLIRLINQLPPGVNRQTGAQIIRQTMEAMGISMKTVLSEAQYIQEDLGGSIQDCMNNIEEYKSNIRVLEQKINVCKKQAQQLGELINLFILTNNRSANQ